MATDIKFFLKNKSKSSNDTNRYSRPVHLFMNKISDPAYLAFISEIGNGGLFFERSLHIYGISENNDFKSLDFVNEVLSGSYGSFFNNLISFGQDVFGNQFAFDVSNGHVVFFNCETADKEIMGRDFTEWLEVFCNDVEYYSGSRFSKMWMERNSFKDEERLCPIKPFVIGGEFELNNLYSLIFPKYVSYNADIAKQLSTINDGQPVRLILKRTDY